jgi:NADH-ubiquinone oxidoreductase chain 3
MTSTTFFIIFIPILAILLLFINLLLAPHNPYQEKDSPFECGFHSFRGQNRTQFSISFFIFALLFLLFDLEILLVYPYSVSSYNNGIHGLIIMLAFFSLLTLGFIFELGKNALSIDSKQISLSSSDDTPIIDTFISLPLQSSIPLLNLLSQLSRLHKNKIITCMCYFMGAYFFYKYSYSMEVVYCMDGVTEMSLKLQNKISGIEENIKYFQDQALGAETDFKEVLTRKAYYEQIGDMDE